MAEKTYQERLKDQILIHIALGSELTRRGVENVIIWMPFLNLSMTHLKQFAEEVADKLEPVARSCSRKAKALINGYTYTVDPAPGIGTVIFVLSY